MSYYELKIYHYHPTDRVDVDSPLVPELENTYETCVCMCRCYRQLSPFQDIKNARESTSLATSTHSSHTLVYISTGTVLKPKKHNIHKAHMSSNTLQHGSKYHPSISKTD